MAHDLSSFKLGDWIAGWQELLDSYLRGRLGDAWPESFAEPLAYPVFTGGKRIRPALCIAAFQALASDRQDVTQVLPAAAALELIHTYSLVHDDLPCMDNDDTRRGLPTVHKKFDEATAVLVGDALLTEAFACIADADLPAEIRIALVGTLSRAAGHRGMVGGQVADITLRGPFLDPDNLERLHRLKTGALIRWAVQAGGVVGRANRDQRDALALYGRSLGLAFQLADDAIDAEQDSGDRNEPSYVRLYGIEETREKARELAKEAGGAVRDLKSPLPLLALAKHCVERRS